MSRSFFLAEISTLGNVNPIQWIWDPEWDPSFYIFMKGIPLQVKGQLIAAGYFGENFPKWIRRTVFGKTCS